jgi:hypothetical protein
LLPSLEIEKKPEESHKQCHNYNQSAEIHSLSPVQVRVSVLNIRRSPTAGVVTKSIY